MTDTARHVVATAFGGPEVLSLQEVAVAEPGPHEVLVDVRAAGVNRMDVKMYAGPGDPAELPMPLGFEVAGVVTAVGEDATDDLGPLGVGDEVIGFQVAGGYATSLLIADRDLTRKPPGLGWAESASLMLTGATAVHALTRVGVGPGDTVLMHGGTGGVGLLAVQLARLRGARVVATAGGDGDGDGHAVLRELGVEPVTYGDGLLDRVRDLAPDGIDAAVDLVGTDEALDVSVALVPDVGRIASIASFDRAPTLGIQVPGGDDDPGHDLRYDARHDLARLAAEKALRVHVAETFPLSRVADAHRRISTGHTIGKLALLV